MYKYTTTQKTLMLYILLFIVSLMTTNCESITEPEPKDWISGELYATLNDDVRDEALEDFLQTYAKYDLSVIFYDRLGNRFRLSFDHKKVNEFKFLEMIQNDQRVISASLKGILPNWIQGKIGVRLFDYVRNDIFDEFLYTYADYELIIDYQVSIEANYFQFSFNMELVDEFDFLEMLQNDERVMIASFNYFHYVGNIKVTDNFDIRRQIDDNL